MLCHGECLMPIACYGVIDFLAKCGNLLFSKTIQEDIMSQAKVDRRKYEKKNRKKLEKQRKIKTTLKCITAALVLGAIVGVPLGIKIYKAQPKFVGDSVIANYVSTYIDENHAADVPSFSSEEEMVEDAATKAIEEITDSSSEETDETSTDETSEVDSEESSETSEDAEK